MTPDDDFMHEAHIALGLHLMKLDQIETHTWLTRKRGLYVAPEATELIAQNVALELACAAMGGKP